MKIIEFLIMALSMIGAGLISFGMFEGFIFFLITNVLGIYFFHKSNMKWMLIAQFVFGVTSVNGIYQNLI